MDEEFFDRLREKVLPYFKGINPCHDFSHVERVLNLAMTLGKKENADLDILKVAVLMHDICRKEQDDKKGEICHAERGAEVARDILEEVGCDKGNIENIIHCVKSHRFRGGNIPESIEAKVLYDADKLDAIGGIGILRATSFAGFVGAVVHNPDVDVENTKTYSRDNSCYREFLFKLVRVRDKMLTKSGREIAKERHDFMVEFFDRVNAEVRGEL